MFRPRIVFLPLWVDAQADLISVCSTTEIKNSRFFGVYSATGKEATTQHAIINQVITKLAIMIPGIALSSGG